MYVTDWKMNRVVRFSATGAFLSQWGTMGSANNQFDFPWGIAVDPADGKVYVSDRSNHRVSIFTSDGSFESKFGMMGEGAGQLLAPSGVAVSQPTGQIYVAENGNSRIQRFGLSKHDYLSQWGSIGGGDGKFVEPGDIAVSNDGQTIYVSDTAKYVVQVFDAGGYFRFKFGGAGTAPGKFDVPVGLAVDSKNRVYVADYGNDRVQVFSPAGEFLTSFGTSGSGLGQMSEPQDIAISPSGIVYVVDAGNHRIQRWQLVETNTVPVLEIKGKKKIRTSSATRVLRGSVADADGDAVTVTARIGRKKARVSGTTSWSLRARLSPGRNKVVITARDTAGATTRQVVRILRTS